MKVEFPFKRVLHVKCKTQEQVARAFMRVQEFYESDMEQFRGKVFDRKTFKKAYAERNGDFTYYADWAGFNVPGTVFNKFLKRFPLDSERWERKLRDAIEEHRPKTGRYYVIGTSECAESGTYQHELSHAFWHLDKKYREYAGFLGDKVPPEHRKQIFDKLGELGYVGDVLEDELVAYLSTSPHG